MKRFLALTLAFVMVLGVCLTAGCDKQPADTTTEKPADPVQTTTGEKTPTDTTAQDNPSETTTSGEDTPVETTDTSETEPDTPIITEWDGYTRLAGFENIDFRGETFVIAGRTTDDVSFPTDIEIYTTETDSISTAVRDRNATIEKLYNCVIEVNSSESPGSLVNAEVTSGKQTIDMYSYFMSGEGAATSGNNYNLYSLGIDFSNSWWDQNYVNSYTIKNSSGVKTMYTMVGDFALTAFSCTHAMFFNKNVYETAIEEKLGYDIYQLVRDGKWTMDIFVEMVKEAGTDVSGNQSFAYSEGDILGWVRTTHATHGLHAATGLQIITTKDGVLDFTAKSDTNQWTTLIDKAIEVWSTPQAETLGYTAVREAITGGNALFASEVLDVLRRMKDADVTCGLVPYPKYSETQENYAHYVDNHLSAYAVPTSVVDLETMGKFIELYAAHSQKIVRSAWIDTYSYEYCGDADSAEMLDIILNSRTYDPGYLYWSTYEGEVSQMINAGKNNFTKWVDKRADSVTSSGGAFDNFIKGISDNKS